MTCSPISSRHSPRFEFSVARVPGVGRRHAPRPYLQLRLLMPTTDNAAARRHPGRLANPIHQQRAAHQLTPIASVLTLSFEAGKGNKRGIPASTVQPDMLYQSTMSSRQRPRNLHAYLALPAYSSAPID